MVGFSTNSDGGSELTLYISTTEVDPVLFVVETLLGFFFTGNATNNSTTIVHLNNSYQVHNSSDRNKGIRIYADRQITVYGLNYQLFTTDAFLALPCSTQILNEYVYYGIMYGRRRFSQFLFVACEDNTTINIASQTILLNKMETYLIDSESISETTGTVAISNKPLSFFSGHKCTSSQRGGGCDHLVEQLPDQSTWGNHFLSASFDGKNTGEIYHVLTSQPSTTVTFTCSSLSQPSTYTLPSAGDWEEITTSDDSFCSIVSNNPVLVVQFSIGGGGLGDTFMTLVPAIDQYSNNYVVPIHPFPVNFITIFVSTEHYQPENIYVDDVSLEDTKWTAIYCASNTTCGYSAYASLTPGDHQVYHANKAATIGVIAYGLGSSVSYGFPADFNNGGTQGML